MIVLVWKDPWRDLWQVLIWRDLWRVLVWRDPLSLTMLTPDPVL
jgi:hypothetical protein